MKDVLFIHGPNLHEAHRMFAETIGADFEEVYHGKMKKGFRRFLEAFRRAKEYPDYPVYLLEGGMPMFPIYLKKRKGKDVKVIGLLADEALVNIIDRLSYYSFFETFIHKISARCLDGAIAVSPFVKSYAEKILDIPIEVARPPISQENYNKLIKVRPNLESNVIVAVVHPGYSDTLVKQFEYAKKRVPELELWIVGEGHPKDYERKEGVKVLGFLPGLSEVFEKASLFVHAGKCSTYPIVTLEAMRAGIPVVVSDMVGTKEIIEKIEDEMKEELNLKYGNYRYVQPLEGIANGIVAYYLSSKEEKELLSKKYRKQSEEFEAKKRCTHFKEVFERLLEDIK